MPQSLLALHDAQGDSKGNIWWTSHKTDVVGKLDPKTGIVTEYTIPLTPKGMPGTHAVRIDKNDVPWFSENWSHNLNRLDLATGKITQVQIEDAVPLNAPGFGNFSLTPDGYVWDSRDDNVRKIDPETGKVVQRYPAAGQLQLRQSDFPRREVLRRGRAAGLGKHDRADGPEARASGSSRTRAST